MAFSPWFLENVKEFGISPENLAKARTAWAAAVAGLKDVPPLPDMGDGVVTEVPDKSSWTPAEKKKGPVKKAPPVQEAKPIKTHSKYKVVASLAQSNVLEAINQPVAVEAPLIVPPPQVEKPKKIYKKKVAVTAPPIAILSEEKPVDVDNVETIEVIARELNGTNYYLDTRKSKVYNPKNGLCVGLWDSVREIIVPHVDSDVE